MKNRIDVKTLPVHIYRSLINEVKSLNYLGYNFSPAPNVLFVVEQDHNKLRSVSSWVERKAIRILSYSIYKWCLFISVENLCIKIHLRFNINSIPTHLPTKPLKYMANLEKLSLELLGTWMEDYQETRGMG